MKLESPKASLKVRTGKIVLDAFDGLAGQRVPFWFMRQAGRYLPEYRELREKKGGFLAMAFDPDAACEITMQPIRRYGMDAAIIFSDILTIPHALGQKLEFAEGEGPKLDPVRSAKEISALGYKEFEKRLAPVYEALKKTRAELTAKFPQTTLIGFAGAPWTVACYMVEGGGSKDFINVKKMAYADPETFSGLIHLLVEATSAYLVKQIEAGAEAIQIFDSWAGVLDESQFQQWVVKPTREIVAMVRGAYPHVPIVGFPRGASGNYFSYIQGTGVNALGLDSQVPTRWAAQTLQTSVPLQGNLDPVALLAGGDAMILAAERIIADLSRGPFVFNLGHGIHKDTPPENVAQLVDLLKNWRLA